MTTDIQADHLLGLAAFLDKAAARRWRARAELKSGWAKLSADLPHRFDPLAAYRIDCAAWDADAVATKLRALGSPEAVCVIGGVDVDEAMMPLKEAVAEVVGDLGGQVIGCVPGKLAYYESRDQGVRMILVRR